MQNWYAAYVKSRHEFVAESELIRKGVNTFLPSVRRLSQWKDRKKVIASPLFPGYLFVYIRPLADDCLNVVKTRGVVQLLSSEAGRPTPVSPAEIHSLMLMVESGQHLDVYPELKDGMRVRVRRGPLQGAEGTLSQRCGEHVFLVNIELLGRSIGVKIYADDVELA